MDMMNVRRSNVNYTTCEFKVGDVLYTVSSGIQLSKASLYAAEVIGVLTNEQTKGMGVHYVIYVTTHVDDYVDLRDYQRVWANREDYLHDLNRTAEQVHKFNQDVRSYLGRNK